MLIPGSRDAIGDGEIRRRIPRVRSARISSTMESELLLLRAILYSYVNVVVVFSVSPATNSSRFSTPGARSLPLTPPGSGVPFEKGTVAISCPDGLAHALSEQNLRLQQIIYEHKVNNLKILKFWVDFF